MATILFVGPCGVVATHPVKVLMLRDNVQHHLQAGLPWPGYPWIHAAADTVIGLEPARPSAHELWSEFSLAYAGIREIKVADLAMSLRTRSSLTGGRELPAVRGTVLLRTAGWAAPFSLKGADTIGELFEDLIRAVEHVTDSGNAAGYVEIFGELGSAGSVRKKRRRKR